MKPIHHTDSPLMSVIEQMSRSQAVQSIERHYVTRSTFLRACRHYRTKGRRILAYMRHASGWTLVLAAVSAKVTT